MAHDSLPSWYDSWRIGDPPDNPFDVISEDFVEEQYEQYLDELPEGTPRLAFEVWFDDNRSDIVEAWEDHNDPRNWL